MIIGLAGKKQVGKSSAANFLVSYGFERISFADPMKELACDLLLRIGLSHESIAHFLDNKETIMPLVNVTMRHLLQTLGTDWGRNMIHPNLWVLCATRAVDKALDAGVSLVIEDVRFEEEASFIRERGGRIVHIFRDNGLVDNHESELGIDFQDTDLVVDNNISFGKFRSEVLICAGVVT